MNRLASWMMRLYPARWRARYGDELDALLADTGADARVVTDLFRGEMRMQFKTWSFVKLALALGIGGLLVGVGIGQLLPSIYTSRATLQITPAKISENMIQAEIGSSLNERIQQMETEILSRTSLSAIINDPRLNLYADERKVKPLEDVIEEMKAAIHINFVALPGAPGRRASAFDISFSYPDRFQAQQTVRVLTNEFMSANMRAGVASTALVDEPLQIVAAPSLSKLPIYPNRLMIVLAGFVVGVTVAAIWRMSRRTGFIARRFSMAAVTFGIAGLAAAIAFMAPNRYLSAATFRVSEGNVGQVGDLTDKVFSRTSLSTIVNDPRLRLYKDQLKTMPLEDVIQMMKKHLAVRQYGRFFTVSFEYADRYEAQQTVSQIVGRFLDAGRALQPTAAVPAPPIPEVLDVLDTASLPKSPTKPNRYLIAWVGCVSGLILAGLIAMVRRRWKPEPGFPVDAIQE